MPINIVNEAIQVIATAHVTINFIPNHNTIVMTVEIGRHQIHHSTVVMLAILAPILIAIRDHQHQATATIRMKDKEHRKTEVAHATVADHSRMKRKI